MSAGRYESAWFVYRLEGEDRTLYVGMTSVFSLRMQNHYASAYGDQIIAVTTERYATEGEAAQREAELIRELQPPLNRAGIEVKEPAPERGECSGCGTPTQDRRHVACDECMRNAYWEYLTTDKTLRFLGDEHKLSRERMRQRFDEFAGHKGLPLVLKRAHRKERAVILAEIEVQREWVKAEMDDVRCVTCGHLHIRHTRQGWSRTCSSRCAKDWQHVRYFFEQEDQLERIASWNVRHADRLSDTNVRFSSRRLTGDGPVYEGAWERRERRWLVPGSRRFQVAVRAYLEDWPAFASWPDEIQRQVREHVDCDLIRRHYDDAQKAGAA